MAPLSMTQSPSDYSYLGQELSLFSHALNWKRYWFKRIAPFMGRTVLEVGAGIGANAGAVCDERFVSWLGLEPDVRMAADLRAQTTRGEFPSQCQFQAGTVANLASDSHYDSVIYIDVLEHIEDDADELRRAAAHVNPGGHIIVLSPAFQWLYTPFDTAIGHYRRYTRRMLEDITPPGMRVRTSFYLDSIGLLASLGNKLLLSSSQPTKKQIRFWDSYMIPLSRWADPIVGSLFGRSVVCVWQPELRRSESASN